jgi:hypothetical protein
MNENFGGELPHASFHDGRVVLFPGDSRDVLKALPENSIDAVVTDPPYALVSIAKRFGGDNAAAVKPGSVYARSSAGFMGARWDTGEVAFNPEFWAEVLRVLKPGGHMVACGGTRTYHRLVCAIEDAGFDVRDAIMWHYGSGFPKSHDVSKGIDRAAGAEREVIGPSARHGGGASKTIPDYDRFGSSGDFITAPATDAAKQWQGWGTALKPSTEIICLARKPISEGTIAANVLRWGTGALNIDGCRIDAGSDYSELNVTQGGNRSMAFGMADRQFVPAKGRWPANLCLSWPSDEYQLRDDVTSEEQRELYGWLSENA